MKKKKTNKQLGTVLVLSIIILSLILLIGLTASKIMVSEIKMTSNTSDSTEAYGAADAGIEYALYQIKQGTAKADIVSGRDCAEDQWFDVGSNKYCLEITDDGFKAIGKAGKTNRALEVEVALAQAGGGPETWKCEKVFATSSVDCLDGYTLITGGCSGGPSSYPKDNGWQCDFSSNAYAWCCQ